MRIFCGINRITNSNNKRLKTANTVTILKPLQFDTVSFSAAMPRYEPTPEEKKYMPLLSKKPITYENNSTEVSEKELLNLLYQLRYDQEVLPDFKKGIITANGTNSLLVKYVSSSKSCKDLDCKNTSLKIISALFDIAENDPELTKTLLLTPAKNGIPIVYAGDKEAKLLLNFSPDEKTYKTQAKAYSSLSKENKEFIHSLKSKKANAPIDIFKSEENLNKALLQAKLSSEKLEIIKRKDSKGKPALISYPKTCIALFKELNAKTPKNSEEHSALISEISEILTSPDSKGRIPISYLNFEDAKEFIKLSPDTETLETQVKNLVLKPEHLTPQNIRSVIRAIESKTHDKKSNAYDILAEKWLNGFEHIKHDERKIEGNIVKILSKEKDEKKRKEIIQESMGHNLKPNPCLTSCFDILSYCLNYVNDPEKRDRILSKYLFESRCLMYGEYLKDAICCVQEHGNDSKNMLRELLFESKVAQIKRQKMGIFGYHEETIYAHSPFINSMNFKDLVTMLKAIKDIGLKREILSSELLIQYSTAPKLEEGKVLETKSKSFSKNMIEKFNNKKHLNIDATTEFEKLLFEILDSPSTSKDEAIELIQTYLPIIPTEKQAYYKRYLEENGAF